MLTKNFERVFVPGIPGSPAVPARPAYTVCTNPPNGEWVWQCSTYYIPYQQGQGFSAKVPPGAIVTLVTLSPPLPAGVPAAGVWWRVFFCQSVWVPLPKPPAPVCTTYPAQPFVPAVPHVPARVDVNPIIGWNAGANSVVAHDGDCEAKWTMGTVVGAYIGLTDERDEVPGVDRLTHALYFYQRTGHPCYRVVESGQARSTEFAYAPGDEFAIRRVREVVSYWRNDEKLQDSLTASIGEVSVGCSLYVSGDAVPDSSEDE